MSVRNRLVTLLVLTATLLFGTGVVFVDSATRVETAIAAQKDYTAFRRELASIRDQVFEYISSRSSGTALLVADNAATTRQSIASYETHSPEALDRAQLDRIAVDLRHVEDAARTLASGVTEPKDAASISELERRLYAGGTDAAAGLDILASRAEQRSSDALAQMRTVVLASMIVVVIATLGGVTTVGLRIDRGLHNLKTGLDQFAMGRLETRIDESGTDEFASAGAGFNRMAEALDRRETELSDLNERLVAADRAKSEFIANMSHDLRTPLNSVIGFSGILLDEMAGPLNEEQRRQIEFVNRSGLQLKSLVEDILEISRFENVGWRKRTEAFSPTRLVTDVVESMRDVAEGKGLKLQADVSGCDGAVVGDEIGCQRILANLVANAVKYTDRGSVDVRATSGDGWFAMDVEDTGPGIPPEDISRVFEPFEQGSTLSAARARDTGTGLGLAIVSRIVEALEGTVSVDSVLGKGSTFRVRIPVS